jgi:hypothetical protein
MKPKESRTEPATNLALQAVTSGAATSVSSELCNSRRVPWRAFVRVVLLKPPKSKPPEGATPVAFLRTNRCNRSFGSVSSTPEAAMVPGGVQLGKIG